MEIKYSKINLEIALMLLSLDKRKLNPKKAKEIKKELKEVLKIFRLNKAEMNKKIAEYHGISVTELMNSKNYLVLCDKFGKHCYDLIVGAFMKKLKITEIQAWALLCDYLKLL